MLILLVAFATRTAVLTQLPPGLTHDEANHGREAIGILDGQLLFYFPLNYGSEPLYSYTAAASMALLGENIVALRLVNVYFGLLTIAATYTWLCRTFGRQTAVLTAALMALSFWPLATSRQALRAGMLPFFMVSAAYFYWQLYQAHGRRPQKAIWGFGLSLVATLHLYLAARVTWLIFPTFLAYLWLWHRPRFRQLWQPTAVGLLITAVLVAPMFIYLQRYPYALTRLDMLDQPLQALLAGQWQPIVRNASTALLAFVWPGYGDQFLAYNIPGRPVFEWATALFFLLGLVSLLRRWRQPQAAFVLLWFIIGIAPSLITGATANSTRNLAALPAILMIPAIGCVASLHRIPNWLRTRPSASKWVPPVLLASWLGIVAISNLGDYFVRWSNRPDVRGAYQQNLVAALPYLTEQANGRRQLISTVYPGAAHDPSIALVLAGEADRRWTDARYALLWPENQAALAAIPSSTPPHAAFLPWLRPLQTVPLRPTDLDPSFTLYELVPNPDTSRWDTAVNLNNALTLRHVRWLEPTVTAGNTAELLTVWQVQDPTQAGPMVPPAFTTDIVMFSQLLDADGRPFAQHDSLEAPSWDWQTGDVIWQIHPISLPADLAPGHYPVILGFYDRTSLQRLPQLDENGQPIDDKIDGPPLHILATHP